MSQLTDEQLGEWLCAYVDGEVDAREKAFVEHLLREDPRAAGVLAELRGVSGAVGTLPRQPAPDTIVEDVRRHVERTELLGAPISHAVMRKEKPRRLHPLLAALAASLVLAAAAGIYFLPDGGEFVLRESTVALAPAPPGADSEAVFRTAPRAPADSPRPVAEPPWPSEKELNQFVDQVLAAGGGPPVEESTPSDSSRASSQVEMELTLSDQGAVALASNKLDQTLRQLAAQSPKVMVQVVPVNQPESPEARRRGGPRTIGASTQQWRVQVPMSQVPRVLGGVLAADNALSQVALSAGPMTIQGSAGAREAVNRIDQAWRAQAKKQALVYVGRQGSVEEAGEIPGEKRPIAPGPGPFGGLLKIMGLPERWPSAQSSTESSPLDQDSTEDERVATIEQQAEGSAAVTNQPMESDRTPEAKSKPATESSVEHTKREAIARNEPSLVERRMRDLDRSAAPDVPADALVAGTGGAIGSMQEPSITLVISLSSAPAAQPGGSVPNPGSGVRPVQPPSKPASQ